MHVEINHSETEKGREREGRKERKAGRGPG
jgi:hypothetical protein